MYNFEMLLPSYPFVTPLELHFFADGWDFLATGFVFETSDDARQVAHKIIARTYKKWKKTFDVAAENPFPFPVVTISYVPDTGEMIGWADGFRFEPEVVRQFQSRYDDIRPATSRKQAVKRPATVGGV